MQLSDRLVGHAELVEVVVTQYDDITEFPLFDRAEVGFLLEEPAIVDGVEADRFFTRNLLTTVDQLSRSVLARDHVVDHVPRIQRRDLSRIRSSADVYSAIDDRAQGRTASCS